MPTRSNKSYGWIKREGKLGGPGYTKKSAAARHRILTGVVKKYGYRSALGSIMALERSTHISATVRKALVADRVWLRETYGAASKKALAAGKKTATKRRVSTAAKPRRVPSVARRTRAVKAAAARIPPASRSVRANPKKKPASTARKTAAATRREQEEREAAAEARRLLEGYVPQGPGELYRWEANRKAPTQRKTRRTRPNPGGSECGYHGVPTMRGECVVCQYEADIKG